MRMLAIDLRSLVSEVASEGPERARPLGIVVGALPQGERALTGGHRLDAVSAEAHALGVSPGQTIAAASATCPSLAVRVLRPSALDARLASVAEVGLGFGALASYALGKPWGPTVWIDVTGCAHLFGGGSKHEGEERLASSLAERVRAMGHTCAVAVASGPRIAAMLARALPPRGVLVSQPGTDRERLAPLAIDALPLMEPELRAMRALGLSTIADAQRIESAALGARLGSSALEVLALMSGDDRARFEAFVPPEVPREEWAFEHVVESSQALVFVARTLVERLALRLAGRGMGVAKVAVELTLDRGGTPVVHELALPTPLSSAHEIFSVVRARIERLTLEAPVRTIAIALSELAKRPEATRSLFSPESAGQAALPRLLGELSAELGAGRVGKLRVSDTHVPEERSQLVPFTSPRMPMGALHATPEPTRRAPEPARAPREGVRVLRHLVRHEHVAWWARPPEQVGRAAYVDHASAWVDERVAWVTVESWRGRGKGSAGTLVDVLGWFD